MCLGKTGLTKGWMITVSITVLVLLQRMLVQGFLKSMMGQGQATLLLPPVLLLSWGEAPCYYLGGSCPGTIVGEGCLCTILEKAGLVLYCENAALVIYWGKAALVLSWGKGTLVLS